MGAGCFCLEIHIQLWYNKLRNRFLNGGNADISKVIRTSNNLRITVVTGNDIESSISSSDKEMDMRAKEAVEAAIKKAKICGKPVARYDAVNNTAYIETSDGERKYV